MQTNSPNGPKDGLITKAYGTLGENERIEPLVINRRYPLRAHDILVDIAYCGICHSDIHSARNEWKNAIYPMVPGHEITGFVKEVGPNVTKFKVGEKCAVGVYVNACHKCSPCKMNLEQYCVKGAILTYNSYDLENETDGCVTYGGYSTQIVVNENYILMLEVQMKKLPNCFR